MENQKLVARHQFEDSRRRIETHSMSSSVSKSSAAIPAPLPDSLSHIKPTPQVLVNDSKPTLQFARKATKVSSITDESTEEDVPTLGSRLVLDFDLKLDNIIRENAEAIRKQRDSRSTCANLHQPPQTYLSVQKRVALKNRRHKVDSIAGKLKPIESSDSESPSFRRLYATNARNSLPGADIAISVGGITIPEA